MDRVHTVPELQRAFAKIRRCATDTDWWMCKALLFVIEHQYPAMMNHQKKKHPLTKYQRFVASRMSGDTGLTLTQIAVEWRRLQEKKR